MNAAHRASLAAQLSPQQVMILDAFQSETYIQNRMDVQHEPLYDTVTLAPGATINETSSSLFTNVGPASGKTFAQTNMSQSRRLPAPEAFSIFSIRLRFSEDILLVDLVALMNGFAFEFYLGQKCYNRGPVWHYNAGGGIFAYTIAAVPAVALYANGVPSREAQHKLAIPLVIENQMEFYARLTGTAAALNGGGTGLILVCLLDGLHARGVQ